MLRRGAARGDELLAARNSAFDAMPSWARNLMRCRSIAGAESPGDAGRPRAEVGAARRGPRRRRLGMGGFGYPSMGAGVFGAPCLYGSWGGPGSGIGMSLPPTPEFGAGAYRAGNQLPYSTVGMGMGVGNPADPAAPAAGNAGRISIGVPSEDAFDNAANGRPSPTRHVRSKRVTAARRPTVRKPTPQPSRKVEAKVTDAVPRRLEVPSARPQQASIPQEKPSALKSEGTKPAPRRSLLGSSG